MHNLKKEPFSGESIPLPVNCESKFNSQSHDQDSCLLMPENTRSCIDEDQISVKMKACFFPKESQQLGVVRQYMVALSASLPFAVAGSAVGWPSPTLPKILAHETPLHLDVVEISWVVSLLYLGNLLSPIPAAYLTNKLGRRKLLLFSGLLPIISWLLILFGTGTVNLYIARFLAGIQFGVVSTVQPIYIGEIAQPNIRGTLSAFNNFMFGAGTLFTFMIGPFVSYYTLAVVLLSIPSLFIITFLKIPESPYYYVIENRMDEARESLFWLRGGLNQTGLELELDQIKKFVQTYMQKQGSFKDIFLSRPSRKAMTISIVFSAVKRLSGAGVIQAYATLTLPKETFGILNPNDCVIILGIVTLFSSLFATVIADKFARKFLLILSCSGCSISMLSTAIWLFLDSKTDLDVAVTSYIPFISYLVQSISYNLACGPIGATVKGELFPPQVKTKSSAIATMILAITSFVLNKFYLIIAHWEGTYLNYLIFAVSCFLAVLFTIYYVPETRGKSLQEIQDILNGVEPIRITTTEKRIV